LPVRDATSPANNDGPATGIHVTGT